MFDEDFCRYALEFFLRAGYVADDEPLYENHSSEQAIYFDADKFFALDSNRRDLFKRFDNVSLAVELGDDFFEARDHQRIRFYSLTVNDERGRSQTVRDAHLLIQSSIDAAASVVLSKCNEQMMLSFAGRDQDCILSEWYDIDRDFERLAAMIDIANVGVRTAAEFFLDIAYCAARDCYIHSSPTAYTLLPIDYFLGDEKRDFEPETINSEAQRYGDDYVERTKLPNAIADDFDVLVDALMFVENEEDVFIDEPDEDESDDTAVEMNLFDGIYDDDDLDDVDPEVLKDPILMVEWLKNFSRPPAP